MSLLIENLALRRASRWLLKDIQLKADAGEFIALVGPNGAGKTSLLRALAGELTPSRGSLRWGGHDLTALSLRDRARQIAVLPQLSSLSFPFTVEEVVLLGRSPHATGRERDQDIAREAMMGLDLLNLRSRTYTHLSGGERQRVQLARVLAQIWEGESRLLLLDEPTSALDFAHQQMLVECLKRLTAQGVSIVMATHDLQLAALHADRILALKEGCCLAVGTPEEVIRAPLMKTVYGVDLRIVAHPQSGKPLALGF